MSTGRTISQLSRRRTLAPPHRLAVVERRRRWVLQLWEAFLLQMDDFDRLIERQLRRKLDPLVAAPVPVRRGRSVAGPQIERQRDCEIPKRVDVASNLGGSLALPY